MIKLLLSLLEKIPYRTQFGLSLADEAKVIYYQKKGYKTHKCLCGGAIITRGIPPDGWETSCDDCEFLADED
jgi:hypothetical protein